MTAEDDPLAPLLAAAATGDRRAFRPLYDATSAKLFGVVLRILRDRAEAEDALQEVYARIWTHAGRHDAAKGRAMTWMIAIARNRAIDRLRARAARPGNSGSGGGGDAATDPDTLADPRGGAEDRLLARAELGRLADCLDRQLPERAAALRGAYVSGESYATLAERHKVPLNTMRTWLRRGLQQLRECMDP
ncbi:MAG: sigma-70 family RNA polymerase sigma factor [Gemmobacter sp.]|uniref:sigma-70 family RNA polymerase sigma factor n=1 Tax=Gemmobacter sp. TaxID=1898957 RepID=UPI003919B4E0